MVRARASARAAAFAVPAMLVGCAHPATHRAVRSVEAAVFDAREAALRVETIRGDVFDLATVRGRAVFVAVVFANDLQGHAVARNLERVAATHPDDIAVLVLAADSFDPETLRTAMEVFAEVAGISRAAVAALPDALRTGSTVFGEVGAGSTVFLVNRAGRIARRLEGYQSVAALEAAVAPALPTVGGTR